MRRESTRGVATALLDSADQAFSEEILGRVRGERRYGQGTANVRTLQSTETETDVIRYEDEEAVAAQNLGDSASIPCSAQAWPDAAAAPRSIAYQFTVARDVEVGTIELLANAQADGAHGAFWVSIWSGDPLPTVHEGTFGSFPAGRVPFPVGGGKTLVYLCLAEGSEFTLNVGTTYWIVIGGADPLVDAPAVADQWRDQVLWVRKEFEAGGTIGTMIVDNSPLGNHKPPYLPAQYTTHTDSRLWYRIYERRHIVRSVPITPGAIRGHLGEAAVLGRVEGEHPLRHVTFPRGGASSATGARLGVSGGTVPAGWSAAHWHDLVVNMPFTPGAVMFADGDGALAHDAPDFFYDSVNKRLGVGLGGMAPNCRVHIGGVATSGFCDQLASAAAGDAPRLLFRRSRGTLAVPTGVLSGDELGHITVHGHHGGGWGEAASMRFEAIQDWAVGARGAHFRIYMALTGSAVLTDQLTLRDGQLRLMAGTAAKPGRSWTDDTNTGEFSPGADLHAVTLGGVERFRWSGDDVGMVPTGQHFWDGVDCAGDTYTYEPSADYLLDVVGGVVALGRKSGHIGVRATGHVHLDGTNCAGDTYIYQISSNVMAFVAENTRQFEVRHGKVWLFPHATVPSADGDCALHSTFKSPLMRLGSVVGRLGGVSHDGLQVGRDIRTSDGYHNSVAIPAAKLTTGARWTLRIAGVLQLGAHAEGPARSITWSLRYGATELAQIGHSFSGTGASSRWAEFHVICQVVATGSTDTMIIIVYKRRSETDGLLGATPGTPLDWDLNQVVATRAIYDINTSANLDFRVYVTASHWAVSTSYQMEYAPGPDMVS